VDEGFLLVAHRLELARGVVGGRGAGDVGEHAELGVEDGDEAAAVAVLGPVVSEVGDEVVRAVAADLAGVAPGIGVRASSRPSRARRSRYCWSLIAMRSVASAGARVSIMPACGPQWTMPPSAPPKMRRSFPSAP